MTYQEIVTRAREVMGPNCRVCPVCDGRACRGEVPGVGGLGSGSSFTVCRPFFDSVKVMMDVVYESGELDTSLELFGERWPFPFFMAPLGGMGLNYNSYLSEEDWSRMSVGGMAVCGSLAFTPDGALDKFFNLSLRSIRENNGRGIPTVKPWATEKLLERLHLSEEVGATAFACDVDSCWHPNMRAMGLPLQVLSPSVMAELVKSSSLPFIANGIMTAGAALRCADAGCYGIVVSTHGGRVIEDAPAPAAMLPEIRAAVGDRMKIFVDGGIRSGLDVFKCLALGADAVLIGRPYVVAACGGGQEGVVLYTNKILAELREIMLMTGCVRLGDITGEKIRLAN